MVRSHLQWIGLKNRTLGTAGLLGCLLLLCSTPLCAQLSTASMNGVVHDSTGAVIPNATVTLTEVETSVKHVTQSNGAGQYVFTSLTPGRYTVEATSSGFRPQKVAEFVLAVGQTGTYDFKLTVGSETTVVNVEADIQQLDVTSANLGTVLATEQVNDLPTNGRNFTALLSLTPGVIPVSTGQNAMGGRTGGFAAPINVGGDFTFPAINGQTNRSNFFLTDGLNNFGSFLSTYAVPPIIDAIQEVKVVSHTDSAEFGSVLGGVVDVVSKSGTNALHGALWEYVRNTIFDASPFLLGIPVAPFHQNQFGASGGGPVWIPKVYNGKDKTFFYVAYQGFRYSTPSNTPLLVPTAAQLSGDESTLPSGLPANPIYDPFSTTYDSTTGTYVRTPFPGNQIQSRVDPAMVAWAQFIFPAAGPYNAATNSNAIDDTPLTQDQNEFNVRVDHHFGKNFAWFRYSMINSTTVLSGGLPGLPKNDEVPARDWGGSYVHTFGPSMVLQVQYARTTVQDNASTRFTKSISDIYDTVGFSSNFAGGFAAINGGNLLPSPGISGYANGGEIIQNTPKATDSHQVSGVVTKIFGKHELGWEEDISATNSPAPSRMRSSRWARIRRITPAIQGGLVIQSHRSCLQFLQLQPSQCRRDNPAWRRDGLLWSGFLEGYRQAHREPGPALRLHFHSPIRNGCHHRQAGWHRNRRHEFQ